MDFNKMTLAIVSIIALVVTIFILSITFYCVHQDKMILQAINNGGIDPVEASFAFDTPYDTKLTLYYLSKSQNSAK